MDTRIRNLGIKDIAGVDALERESFFLPWSRGALEEEILHNARRDVRGLELLHRDGSTDLIGYYMSSHVLDETSLDRIGVRMALRGRGFGARLMQDMLQCARRNRSAMVFLEVRVRNESALALYRRCGFEIVGTRKNYYPETHEDAYLMRRDLSMSSGQK